MEGETNRSILNIYPYTYLNMISLAPQAETVPAVSPGIDIASVWLTNRATGSVGCSSASTSGGFSPGSASARRPILSPTKKIALLLVKKHGGLESDSRSEII